MPPFEYIQATDPAQAVATVTADPAAAYLAGGTTQLDLVLKDGIFSPERLVDITRLPLKGISASDAAIRVGATTTMEELAADPAVIERLPFVREALLHGASVQLRNMATVGGNLLQRTRCPYFQDTGMPCNKREPGSGCQATAPGADTEHMAILGHSPFCVATHPSDMAVALTALGARVRVTGQNGDRLIEMPGLHRLPDGMPDRDTVLRPGELITEVELPPPPAGRSAYRKVRERASFAFALVSLAAVLETGPDGRVRDCRLALGGVAHVPWRAHAAERVALSLPATPETFARAAEEELRYSRPLPGNEYKVTLARNLIASVLEELAA